jgi:hypothetical protein
MPASRSTSAHWRCRAGLDDDSSDRSDCRPALHYIALCYIVWHPPGKHTRRKPGPQSHGSSPPPRRRPSGHLPTPPRSQDRRAAAMQALAFLFVCGLGRDVRDEYHCFSVELHESSCQTRITLPPRARPHFGDSVPDAPTLSGRITGRRLGQGRPACMDAYNRATPFTWRP